MLGAKERALLLALSETEYCTSGTLAKALGVSSKTAQGMVKDLREKLQENGADILARTRHGYLLQVNDRALFETLSSGENAAAHFIPSGSEERVRYLLVLLLGQVDYTARVKSLIQCRDYPWFMRLLCGENGGSRENKTQKQNSKTQKEYESL